MRKSKKLIALGLTAAMALAPATVFADNAVTREATTTPVNDFNVNVGVKNAPQLDMEVFDVILPTQDFAQKVMFFYIDPSELIASTKGVALSQGGISTWPNGQNNTLIFKNYNATGSAVTGFSNSSNALIVENKGTAQVDIRADVTVTPNGNVKIVTADAAVASGKAANLKLDFMAKKASVDEHGATPLNPSGLTSPDWTEYVTMKPSWTDEDGEVHKRTEAKAIMDVSAAALAASHYEVTQGGVSAYNAASDQAAQSYKYQLKSTDLKAAEQVGFWFSGKCNPKANWETTDTATVNVAWTLEKHIKYETGKATLAGEYITLAQNAAGANFDKDECTVNELKVRLWFADKTYTEISNWRALISEDNNNALTCAQGEVLTEGFTGEGVIHDSEPGVHYTKAEFFYKVNGIWYTATITP